MINSRSAKVLILSSGQALTALVGIISMAVLTRVFSKLDYATYRQTLLAYAFAVPFVTLGLDRALYFFLPGEKKRPRALLVENLLLLTLAGAVLSLFILLGGNQLLAQRMNNPDLASILLLLVPYPLFMLPASAMSACLMARDRTEQVAGFNVGSRFVMLVLVLLPVLFWATPAAAIIGTVVGAAITTAAALYLMFRACPSGPWRPQWSSMKAQLAFGVPLGLATLVGTVSFDPGSGACFRKVSAGCVCRVLGRGDGNPADRHDHRLDHVGGHDRLCPLLPRSADRRDCGAGASRHDEIGAAFAADHGISCSAWRPI